jgi:hydrogenase maturation protease
MPSLAHLTRMAVIGCGNANRSDDGVGPEVIRRLRERVLPDWVDLHDAGTDGMGVLYRARGVSHLVIVDAQAPDTTPGALYEAPGDALAAAPAPGAGLHEFRWDHALHAGRIIHGAEFPAHVRVLLIEAADLSLGLELSPAVAAAAEIAATRVVALVGAAGRDGWQ